MGIEIRGFDEAIQSPEELGRAVKPETLLEWANRIESTIKQDCAENVTFKGLINQEGKFEIKFNAKAKDIDCVVAAIRKHLGSMHPATRKFYEQAIKAYESNRPKG